MNTKHINFKQTLIFFDELFQTIIYAHNHLLHGPG